MRVHDPYQHTLIPLSECAVSSNGDGYAIVRPFGSDRAFRMHVATGQTEKFDVTSISEGKLATVTADSPAEEVTLECKALFVDAPLKINGLTEVVPNDLPIPESPDLIRDARRTLFQESAGRRRALIINMAGMTPTQLDAAARRLEAAGYDCFGLVVKEDSPIRIKQLHRLFGDGRVQTVNGSGTESALSLLSRPLNNPRGQAWKVNAKAESVRKSPFATAFTAPSRRSKAVSRPGSRRGVLPALSKRESGPRQSLILSEGIEDDDPHTVAPGWQLPDKADWRDRSYGAIVYNSAGQILLREPSGHYGGYAWTFSKGKMDSPDEKPIDVATREVGEETGITGTITGYLPGAFKGTTGTTYFFLIKATGQDKGKMDDETKSTKWVTPDEAAALIQQSASSTGRSRDLQILKAAATALHLPYTPMTPTKTPASPPSKSGFFARLFRSWGPNKESLDEDGGPADSGKAAKLASFIVHHPKLKQQYLLQVVRPVGLYKAKGTYNHAKAPKLARHLVVAGGRLYARQHKLPGLWHSHFSQKTREAAEVMVRDRAIRDAGSHRYDAILPAKYRKGFQGYGKPLKSKE